MRTERNKDGSWNVWPAREEYQAIPQAADSFEHEIAARLMDDCGLRVSEDSAERIRDVRLAVETDEIVGQVTDPHHFRTLEVVDFGVLGWSNSAVMEFCKKVDGTTENRTRVIPTPSA